jgi:hypothetical protein
VPLRPTTPGPSRASSHKSHKYNQLSQSQTSQPRPLSERPVEGLAGHPSESQVGVGSRPGNGKLISSRGGRVMLTEVRGISYCARSLCSSIWNACWLCGQNIACLYKGIGTSRWAPSYGCQAVPSVFCNGSGCLPLEAPEIGPENEVGCTAIAAGSRIRRQNNGSSTGLEHRPEIRMLKFYTNKHQIPPLRK